jgi:hypothetical protein
MTPEAKNTERRRRWPRVVQMVAFCGVAALAYAVGVRRGGSGGAPAIKPESAAHRAQLPIEALQALAVASQTQAGATGARSAAPSGPAEAQADTPGAPPPPEPSAREHRDNVVAELRASGPDRRGLAAPAAKVLTGWTTKIAGLGVEGRWGRVECHAKGCLMTAVHPNEEAANKASEVITRTGEFNGWQAGKMRSGIIARGDGAVEVTWVLYPPPAGEAALAATLPDDVLEELQRAWSPAAQR